MWEIIKDIFYAIGSVAGVVALSRPVFEGKYNKDAARYERIRALVDEQMITDLPDMVYAVRRIPDKCFLPFEKIKDEISKNHDSVRFSGPLKKFYLNELASLIANYESLRAYIQVSEWEPVSFSDDESGGKNVYWQLNKKAFYDSNGVPKDYGRHLKEASDIADEMRKSFQRLQLVADLHFLEIPLAAQLLRRSYKRNGLQRA